jgi:hypothetical protein
MQLPCPSCGTLNSGGDRYCDNCGRAFSRAAPPAPRAQLPQQVPVGQAYVPLVAVQPQRTNGLAVASMVLGILWLYWIGSILALVLGYVAKSQIDNSRGQEGGRGMAIAGITLGWIGVGVLLLTLLAVGSVRSSV